MSRQTIFKGWSKKELEKLASVMIIQKIPYGTVIVEQGGEADALYFILSGEVRVIRKINSVSLPNKINQYFLIIIITGCCKEID